MTSSTAIAKIKFEFLYPLFERADVKRPPAGHWSERSDAARLEDAAREEPGSVERWRALGEYWLGKGNFIRARAAFDEAHRLAPADAAILLQRAAATATLDPPASARDTAQAIAMGADPQPAFATPTLRRPAADEAVPTVYVDLTDMMDYLKLNTMFSGIQRVVANVVREAWRRSSPNARDVVPVIQIYDERAVYRTDLKAVVDMIDLVERGRPNRAQLDRMLATVLGSMRVVAPCPGDIFLMAGAFWTVPSYDLLKEMREAGVAVTIFIHDLIQIDNPEYVHASATETFRRSLVDVAEVSSFITTNSAYVASEVRRFFRRDLGLEKPVYPVPLATEMSLNEPDPWQKRALAAEFGPAGYVLCVCTIEVRKNHVFIYRIWEELVRRGHRDIPTLVFVGKWGWSIADFQETLARSNYLDGRIRVMTSVSDAELAGLYRNCRFSIYPSFAEGWGLPIGESLILGRPCIASGVTSMPEVGGRLVRYVDPFDVATGIEAVTRVLDDPQELADWTEQVRAEFVPRRWSDFSEQLLGASRALALADAPPAAFARLLPGEIAVLGHHTVRDRANAGRPLRTARMARYRGWDDLIDDGAWSLARTASIRFLAEGCDPGTTIDVVLSLRGEIGRAAILAQLHAGDRGGDWVVLGSQPSEHRCAATVGADGLVEIAITVRGDPVRHGGVDHFVHLSRVGYCRAGNADDVLALQEGLCFG